MLNNVAFLTNCVFKLCALQHEQNIKKTFVLFHDKCLIGF